jgi:predicted ATPase
VFHIISALVIGPAYLTWRELANLRYIGPIRDVPTRLLQEVAADSDLSWSRGNAAWNTLFKGTTDFVQEVSDWLSRKDRLDTGYGVRIKQVVELADDVLLTRFLQGDDLEILDDLRHRLRSTPKRKQVVLVEEESGLELAPGEVGTGLSQVVPVVVAALEPSRTFVAVEQPELHVHPRVQTGLADLLIRGTSSDYDEEGESAVDAPPIFLIETHSEHLMLRLLRRIEESTDGVSPEHLRPITPAALSVNYLYADPAQHKLLIVPLRIDKRGEFIDKWPHGFFGERADELFR